MTTVSKTVVVKKMSEAQFAWSLKRGFIWQVGGEDSNMFVSKKYEYFWVPTYVNKNREIDGGYWEVLETKLVTI
jgi:hypothetical protein